MLVNKESIVDLDKTERDGLATILKSGSLHKTALVSTSNLTDFSSISDIVFLVKYLMAGMQLHVFVPVGRVAYHEEEAEELINMGLNIHSELDVDSVIAQINERPDNVCLNNDPDTLKSNDELLSSNGEIVQSVFAEQIRTITNTDESTEAECERESDFMEKVHQSELNEDGKNYLQEIYMTASAN